MAKVALLIGVSEYLPGLHPLPSAVKDVEAMQQVLQNQEMDGFDQVKPLLNPNPQVMREEMEALFAGRTKDDLALLFFSGHGIKDDRGRLYFATRDTRKTPNEELIRSTAVEASFVHELMSNSRCKRQVVILDCCFSGAFAAGMEAKDSGIIDIETQLGGEGRVVLTSSTSTQYSFEEQASDLSIYTRYIVEGIATGAADLNNDGWIELEELHDYAHRKVHETAPAMKPEIYAVKEGFKIRLAKAPVGDPKLRYRQEAERYTKRGEISSIGRIILDTLQVQLKLLPEEATTIENELLQPYRDRLKNLQRYREVFIAAVESGYPLSEQNRSDLKHFQDILGLRDEDTAAIEAEITSSREPALAPPPPQPSPSPIAEPTQKTTAKTETTTPPPAVPISPHKQTPWMRKTVIGIVISVTVGISYLIFYFSGKTPTQTTEKCFVAVNGNIRSEPSQVEGDKNVIISPQGKRFPVTGRQTSGGWVEVELSPSRLGWAHRNVIYDETEMDSCLQRNGVNVEMVNNIPRPSETPTPPPISDRTRLLLDEAQKLADKGKFAEAIATAQKIPSDSPVYQEAQAKIKDWQEKLNTPQKNSISAITFNPASPANLKLGQKVSFTFKYLSSEAGGVRIWGRPFTNGATSPNYAAHSSPVYPTGEGSGEGNFTISSASGEILVDQIRFQMWTTDNSKLLYEYFIPTKYRFTGESQSLSAPEQLSPDDESVFDHFPRTTKLQWSAVPGAANYTVEVEFCQPTGCSNDTARWKLVPNLQVTSYTFDFVGAQPGRWRVWAVDANGRESPKSDWREFRYTR